MGTAERILRPARPADAPAIAALYLESRKQLVPFAPLAHGDEDVRGWIKNDLVPSGTVVVAVIDEQIVGMCATAQDDGAGWIEHLYILPGHTGAGIGTALLNHALQHLPLPVRLYTFQANTGARRFYERHGFVPVAFGDGTGNEEGVPDVLYERSARLP